jgi:hypothetical protein
MRMTRNVPALLVAVTALCLLVSSAKAAVIFTESFESPDITGLTTTDPTGWTAAGHPSYTGLNDVDSGMVTTPYGSQVVKIYGNASLTTSDSILSNVLETSMTYTLTFNVTERSDKSGFDTRYAVDLMAGTDVLGTVAGQTTLTDMSESDTIVYTTGAAHPNAGDTLRVRLRKGTGGNWQSNPQYDNLQLDASPSVVSDNTPPTPDPMTWAVAPTGVDFESIYMKPTEASDASGVENLFTNTTTPNSSGWQFSNEWDDIGLDPDTTYTYTVKARDLSANQNETGPSTPLSATTAPPIEGLIFRESFESPDVTGLTNTDPTGWTATGHPNYTGLNDEDSGVLATPYLSQAVKIYGDATLTTTPSILDEVVADPIPGTKMVYTLSFNVAERTDNANYDTRFLVDLLAGSTVLATLTGEVTTTDMSEVYSLIYSANHNGPYAGETLGIRLRKGSGGNWQSNPQYDNVILTGVLIPEPASLSLLGLGGLALLRRRRRRA